MIYTITLNPAVDYTIKSTLNLGETNRTNEEYFQIGGKGINVSILLNNLQAKSNVLGFIGGFSGTYIQQQLKVYKYITNNLIETDVITRINIKIKSEQETEINSAGPIIKPHFLLQLENQIKELTKNDLLIIGGAYPQGITNWYEKICEQLNKNKIPFIIDIASKSLLDILKYKPLLIKPNKQELSKLFEDPNIDEKKCIKYGITLRNRGAKNVIISLGNEGALFFCEKGIFKATNAKGKLINSVGAGDSVVAGFAYYLDLHKNEVEAFKFAISCGSATAYSKGIAKKDLIIQLNEKTKIEEIYHD